MVANLGRNPPTGVKGMPDLLCSFLAACVGGYLGLKSRIPSGVMLGATCGVLVCRALTARHVHAPGWVMFAAQVLLGLVIAEACDRELARRLASLMWPMVISCMVLILAGFTISYVYYRMGIIDFPTAYLAGSPGAMHVMVAISGDMKADLALVTAFHSVRLIIVSVTAPLIFKFFVQG